MCVLTHLTHTTHTQEKEHRAERGDRGGSHAHSERGGGMEGGAEGGQIDLRAQLMMRRQQMNAPLPPSSSHGDEREGGKSGRKSRR